MKVEAFLVGWLVFPTISYLSNPGDWDKDYFFIHIILGLAIGFIAQTVRVYLRKEEK